MSFIVQRNDGRFSYLVALTYRTVLSELSWAPFLAENPGASLESPIVESMICLSGRSTDFKKPWQRNLLSPPLTLYIINQLIPQYNELWCPKRCPELPIPRNFLKDK